MVSASLRMPAVESFSGYDFLRKNCRIACIDILGGWNLKIRLPPFQGTTFEGVVIMSTQTGVPIPMVLHSYKDLTGRVTQNKSPA